VQLGVHHIQMRFEWDEIKRTSNFEKHGLDFREAPNVFDGRPVYSYPSPRLEEQRIVTVGQVNQRLVAFV